VYTLPDPRVWLDDDWQQLITVTPDDPLRKAVKLMTDFKVRALPVISVSLSGGKWRSSYFHQPPRVLVCVY